MTPKRETQPTADVPTQVFSKFLETVATAGGDVDMIGRLKVTLLEKQDFTLESLESAIFGKSTDDD